jgi:hypothetical protein
LKNENGGFGRGWRKKRQKRRGNKGGMEGGWGWIENGMDIGGSSPSEESKRCMTVCIPGSILTLTRGRVLKVETEEWGGVRNSMDTFVQGPGIPYTLYLPAHSSHVEDPLSETLGFSRTVNDNKEVVLS